MRKRSKHSASATPPGSVPLDYTIAAFASSDGSCTGALSWLTTQAVGSTVKGGDTQNLNFYVHPGALAVGTYNAELCLTFKAPADRVFSNGFEANGVSLVVPVVLNIVAGPVAGAYTIDQPVEDDQAGSALDLATGSYHTWNAFLLDNINLYNDAGNGLAVYWYNDVITGANKNKVGGVYDSVSGSYKVLQSGDVVGPAATFNRTVSDMTNFFGGCRRLYRYRVRQQPDAYVELRLDPHHHQRRRTVSRRRCSTINSTAPARPLRFPEICPSRERQGPALHRPFLFALTTTHRAITVRAPYSYEAVLRGPLQ